MVEFLVTTSKGLDELLLQELQTLLPQVQFKGKPGQVLFHGDLKDAYTICLWSRLANRVLLKFAGGPINSADDLYNVVSQVNWPAQFDVNQTFVVDFSGTNRTINNTQFGALKAKDAIVDQFNDLFEQRPSVDKQNPHIRVHCRVWKENFSVYLDLSGKSLHQRHYRQQTGQAPLKEHIACAMLYRSGWANHPSTPLYDPMCGSGTVVIEAALMAANIAPGRHRNHWGFSQWKGHKGEVWQQLLDEADQQQKQVQTAIYANELDIKVLNHAKQNAQNAGVFDLIQFSSGDGTKKQLEATQPGYIVSNPPYGERLSELTELLPVFQRWGMTLKQHFQGWQLSLLTSNRDLLRQLKLVSKKQYQMMNGPIECQLVNFVLDEKNCQVHEVNLDNNDFANRLKKNIKRLEKWLKQQNTNCYRIYDADLPEYNVAIDRYDDWLVVQEYAPPKDVPEQKARKRLHEVVIALPQVLGIPAHQIALKTRMQQKGTQQYEKVATNRSRMVVEENGAKFWVNLTDYLDTGLFLDHRITRQKIQQMAKGKDVLNLFAYTGSVSVHAALGGAKSVTTVDMSKTYIQWAKDNWTLNELRTASHFIQADCTTWLSQHQQRYDLIFIDPPSFSNSKRMHNTWDVQRDHVALLREAKRCLAENGIIVFSNNLRSFKLDETEMRAMGFQIENISQQTLPEDFKRNPKIHQCWILKA